MHWASNLCERSWLLVYWCGFRPHLLRSAKWWAPTCWRFLERLVTALYFDDFCLYWLLSLQLYAWTTKSWAFIYERQSASSHSEHSKVAPACAAMTSSSALCNASWTESVLPGVGPRILDRSTQRPSLSLLRTSQIAASEFMSRCWHSTAHITSYSIIL